MPLDREHAARALGHRQGEEADARVGVDHRVLFRRVEHLEHEVDQRLGDVVRETGLVHGEAHAEHQAGHRHRFGNRGSCWLGSFAGIAGKRNTLWIANKIYNGISYPGQTIFA